MTDLERANKYWEDRESDVWSVAIKNGLDTGVENLMETTDFDLDSFLFDLFDNGEADLETVDILGALLELFE